MGDVFDVMDIQKMIALGIYQDHIISNVKSMDGKEETNKGIFISEKFPNYHHHQLNHQ